MLFFLFSAPGVLPGGSIARGGRQHAAGDKRRWEIGREEQETGVLVADVPAIEPTKRIGQPVEPRAPWESEPWTPPPPEPVAVPAVLPPIIPLPFTDDEEAIMLLMLNR